MGDRENRGSGDSRVERGNDWEERSRQQAACRWRPLVLRGRGAEVQRSGNGETENRGDGDKETREQECSRQGAGQR